jgi:hypothetical protein
VVGGEEGEEEGDFKMANFTIVIPQLLQTESEGRFFLDLLFKQTKILIFIVIIIILLILVAMDLILFLYTTYYSMIFNFPSLIFKKYNNHSFVIIDYKAVIHHP